MTEPHSFQVNLRGVIELLSGHLYSGPQVYLRELVQNAADAIAAHELNNHKVEGNIDFQLCPGSTPTLIVTDNGVGLTTAEVHQFLATIGMSSKRGAAQRDTFIGQFGIGLLSAFMVSDEIVLITKSVVNDAPAVKWTGRSDGTYVVEELDSDLQSGSQVFLRCKPGCSDFFDPTFVESTLSKYAKYLHTPIWFDDGNDRRQINRTPPWAIDDDSESEESESSSTGYLATIPLKHPEGRFSGVAKVLPVGMNTPSRSGDEVYLKGMLVSDRVDNLLPEWAFFVKCVVNVTELRPTASRESFHDDELLAETRADLGATLRKWLIDVSQEEPELLEKLVAIHHLPLKALAAGDDEFFELFADWLPFETTLGRLTIAEIKRHSCQIRYTHSLDQFRQIAGVANAQDICLINGGYVYDTELMQQFAKFFPEFEVQEINASEIADSFSSLNPQQEKLAQPFLELAQETLAAFRCRPVIRCFEPSELPTIYTTDPQADFLRLLEGGKHEANELFQGLFEDLERIVDHSALPQLCFNFNNALISRLIELDDSEVVSRAIEMLYLQSLLMGHYPLKPEEIKLINSGLLGFIELSVLGRSGRGQ